MISELIVNRLLSVTFELAALTIAAFCIIKLIKIKSAKLRSMIWLVVMIKPIVSLMAGAPFSIVTINQPKAISSEIGSLQLQKLIISQIDENLSQVSESKSKNTSNNLNGKFLPENKSAKSESGKQSAMPELKSVPQNSQPKYYAKFGRIKFKSVMVVIWILGLFICILKFASNYLRMRSIIENSSLPAAKDFRMIYEQTRAQIGLSSAPIVRVSANVKSPAILGIIKPVVIIPKWLDEEKNQEELKWSLAHEFNHFKSLDYISLFVRNISAALFFFHPCMWIVSNKWEEAMELACDRGLIKDEDDAREYAGSLFEILKIVKEEKTMKFANGLFATRTQIGRRIAILLGGAVRTPAKISAFVLSMFIVLSMTIILSGLSIAENSAASGNQPQIASAANPAQASAPVSASAETPADENQVTDPMIEKARRTLQVYAYAAGKIPENYQEIIQSGIFEGMEKDIAEECSWEKTETPNEYLLEVKGTDGAFIKNKVKLSPDWRVFFDESLYPDTKYAVEAKKAGEDNSIYQYVEAGRCYTTIAASLSMKNHNLFPFFDTLDKDNQELINNPDTDINKETDKKLVLFLKIFRPAFEIYHTARLFDKTVYPESIGLDTPVPNFLSAQYLAKFKTQNAVYLMRTGKYDEALQECLDIMDCGWKYRSEKSPLINNLIGMAVESIGLRSLHALVVSGKLDSKQLLEVTAALSRIDESEKDIGRMLTVFEWSCMYDILDRLGDGRLVYTKKGIFPPNEVQHEDGVKGLLSEGYWYVTNEHTKSAFKNNRKKYADEIKEMTDYCIESLNMTTEQYQKEKRNDAFMAKIMQTDNPIIRYSLPNYLEAKTRMLHVKAKRRITAAAAMSEIKKLERGQYQKSDSANQALPAELAVSENLALDNFFNKKLINYISDGTKYQIYSAGPDLTDNKAEFLYDPTNGTLSTGDIYFK